MPAARAASTIDCSAICSGARPASGGRRKSAARSLVPAISAAASCAIAGAASTPVAVSIIARTGLPSCLADFADEMSRRGPRQDGDIRIRLRNGDEVEPNAIRCRRR